MGPPTPRYTPQECMSHDSTQQAYRESHLAYPPHHHHLTTLTTGHSQMQHSQISPNHHHHHHHYYCYYCWWCAGRQWRGLRRWPACCRVQSACGEGGPGAMAEWGVTEYTLIHHTHTHTHHTGYKLYPLSLCIGISPSNEWLGLS